ncbi:MAG: PAS domain S-box protein [Deltaproteobacteria bacterium]|nr:PAS domain S-box protein [Deltaproteobacteria bacterium]
MDDKFSTTEYLRHIEQSEGHLEYASDADYLLTPEFMRYVLDVVKSGLIITDLSGSILFFSRTATELFGYQPPELLARPILHLFLPDDLDILYPNIINITTRAGLFQGEVMLARKGGARFFAYLSVNLYNRDPAGRLIFTVQDIDKIKRVEREYNNNRRFHSISRMADGVAHELRNPLSTIGGLIRRLTNKKVDEINQSKYMDAIIKNVIRMENIVRDVDAFAKIPAPNLKPEEMLETVGDIYCQFRKRLAGTEVSIKMRMNGDDEMRAFIDRELITRALSAIVDNAYDALKGHGEITLELDRDEDYIIVTITDNGCGIPPDELDLIFNPFYSTKTEGIGIQLAITKRIVEDHGGHIEINSQVGQGTVFKVFLLIERRRRVRRELVSAK